MHPTKPILLCAAIAVCLSVTGCGQKPSGASGVVSSPSSTPAVTQTTAATVSPSPAQKQAVIQTYYSNPDGTALVAKEASIRYAKDEDKYAAALNALKTSPSSDAVSLCPHVKFNSAKLEDGKLTVDITLPDEDRLGAFGEGLLLDALRKTLFQFTEVNTFAVLVDGKKTDSLMGHYELPELFKR